MNVLKKITTSALAVATALVTLTAATSFAQEFAPGDRGGMDRGGRDRQRQEYLGSTGLVRKGRMETRVIRVGANRGEYSSLQFVARDDAFQIQRASVIFGNGQRRDFGGTNIPEGASARLDFNQPRRIERIVIQGTASNPFGSDAQLEVYGRRY